jgi:primary-amine oxidase
MELHEPPKAALVSREDGDDGLAIPDRQAFCVLHERRTLMVREAVVSLTARTVVEIVEIPGAAAPLLLEEFGRCERAVAADPRWQAAMRRRGVSDLTLAMIDTWPAGHTGPHDDPARRRIARPLTFVRASPRDNGYARPVEGLLVEVDLDTMTVLAVTDHPAQPTAPTAPATAAAAGRPADAEAAGGSDAGAAADAASDAAPGTDDAVVPLPRRPGNYAPDLLTGDADNVPSVPALRPAPAPLVITQPAGPDVVLDGHQVRWQNWELRIGFTPREGLVLHQIRYVDQGRPRPIVHRASVSELFVPYGDPAPTHRGKNVFDIGEYGIGQLANSLELGCDCLGEIRYLDVVFADADGEPVTIPQAICVHEEDVGIAWKHLDYRLETVEVRRMRRLVISMISTVGNYEYGFFWYLYLDGVLEFEVKLTGVVSTGAVPPGRVPTHGQLIAPGLYGPNHQHFFSVRLDMEVDGGPNSVLEVDSVPEPAGPDNPTGNAWRVRETPLVSELAARRDVSTATARYWKVTNPRRRNLVGEPVAYRLMPGHTAPLLAAPDSGHAARGRFAAHQLWVTARDERERYAAGRYPNQNAGEDGLPRYAAADRPLLETDVVLWYTCAAHHVVRPEDWPVMPVSRVGFELRPAGFFDGNPALDLPPSAAHCHPAGASHD